MRPNVAILSIPQVRDRTGTEPAVTAAIRKTVFLHELSHGEYYSNPDYADYCRRFWFQQLDDQLGLNEAQRELFRKFLATKNYATEIEELMINEMQAYLMFTPDAQSFNAAKLNVSELELATMRDAFRRGKPPTRLISLMQ
jgi:hypothetical protein